LQQRFTVGLRHCSELNGTNFYFPTASSICKTITSLWKISSRRVCSIPKPSGRRPSRTPDARWAQVTLQARADQANCALVASLPFLQKELDEMQQQAPPPQGTTGK
jgi:hypothetical protein